MEPHLIHPELLRHKVRVLVVGCGGNGSAIAAGLPYLHQALLVYGHPEGLHVTLLDPEVISPTNCVRQPFSRSEVGLYKSVVLANRLNLFWGVDWEGEDQSRRTLGSAWSSSSTQAIPPRLRCKSTSADRGFLKLVNRGSDMSSNGHADAAPANPQDKQPGYRIRCHGARKKS